MAGESYVHDRALPASIAVLLFVGVGCGGHKPQDSTALTYQTSQTKRVEWVTDPETARMLSVVLYGDGEFLVGADFPAGLYESLGGTRCKWSRQSLRPDGSFGEVQSGGGPGVQRVEVQAADLLFRSAGCLRWDIAK
jgi:hypothetical protein